MERFYGGGGAAGWYNFKRTTQLKHESLCYTTNCCQKKK